MSEEQIVSRIPETVRKRILTALKQAGDENGCVPVISIPKILEPLGLQWRDYALGSKKLGEWLDKWFPEFERVEDGKLLHPRTSAMPIVTRPKVSGELKTRINGILNEALADNQPVLLSHLGSRLLAAGIDRRVYTNESLADWLTGLFPSLHKSDDGLRLYRNGANQTPTRPKVSKEVKAQIRSIVDEAMEEGQSALLSHLGSRLLAAGIDRRVYTNESLADWLIGMDSSLYRSEDGLLLCRSEGASSGASGGSYPPAAQSLSLVDLDEDIRQMQNLVFFGWWSNHIRALKRYTGCSGNDEQTWKGIVSQRLSEILLGGGTFIQSGEGEDYRFAFYTGMDTQDRKPIYAVLIHNINNKNGKLQPLMLEDFCFPGGEENPVLSRWLEENMDPGQLRTIRQTGTDLSRLEEQCAQVEQLRLELIPRMESALEALKVCGDIPQEQLPALETYREARKKLRELCREAEVPQEMTACQQILEWCAGQNRIVPYLRDIEESFDALLQLLAQLSGGKDLSQDRQTLLQACEASANVQIQAVLKPYQQLLELMEKQALDAGTVTLSEEVERHFGFKVMQVFGMVMLNKDRYQQIRACLETLQERIAVMDTLSQSAEPVTEEVRQAPLTGELLADVCSGTLSGVWNACCGTDPLEKLIVEDRLPEAQEFAADAEAMEDAGYDEEFRQQILETLTFSAELPEGRTVYSAGRRLVRILGEQNVTAERCFLLGLLMERAECSTELLQIYRRTEQQEKFLAVWTQFGEDAAYSVENYTYYIRQLAGVPSQQILAYLDSHVFLYYLPECADAILSVMEEPERTQLQQELQTRFAAFSGELNPLELALVADQKAPVLELLDNREALTEMGYTEEQITQISQAAIHENCPTGTAPHKIGLRLWLYQRDLHGLAERYLWQGLAEDPAGAGDVLIRLLAQQQRWSECIRLYNFCGSEAGTESRQAYLLAMLHAEPIRAQQLIPGNLQDLLTLLYQNAAAREAVAAYRDSSNEAFREFYEKIWELSQVLEEDFPRSVILHDRNLRDMITKPELLAGLELPENQIESAKLLYQSGNYPQGGDAAGVGGRVFAFLGTYRGIAEKLGRFALPSEEGAKLLWSVYGAMGDVKEQHKLLQEHPVLRQSHPGEYSRYLFHSAQYGAFLEWVAQMEATPLRKLRQAVALLKLDPAAPMELPEVGVPATEEYTSCLTMLLSELARAGRLEEVETILIPLFPGLLKNCAPEDIRRVMTAEGALSPIAVSVLQAHALEQQEPMALYYYNTLRIGDLQERSEAYYQTALEACGEIPMESRLARMEELAKLYPDRAQELGDRMWQLKVYDLAKTEPVSRDVAEKLALAMEQNALDADGIRQMLQMIRDSAYGDSQAVIGAVCRITENNALHMDGMLYLHRVAERISKQSVLEQWIYEPLCSRYLDALNQGVFPEALADEAAKLCRRIIRNDPAVYQVALCLFRIEQLRGQKHQAEYILRYLATKPVVDLGSNCYAVVSVAVEDLWHGIVPSALSLFRSVLQDMTPDGIREYCKNCSVFAEATSEDQSAMFDQIQNLRKQKMADADDVQEYGQCTEAEGESLVKVICTTQDKDTYWWACTNLPGLTAEARGKLLYLCAMVNGVMWKECVKFCVTSEQNAMLLQALQEWVRTDSPGPKNCRNYLDEALLEDPNFFRRWEAPEEMDTLHEILELLCKDCKEDLRDLPIKVGHSVLNAVSSITVGIGDDRATEILEEYLSAPLLVGYSEVGVATALRLLLAGRVSYARHLLDGLNESRSPLACRMLVEKLGVMTEETLSDWAQAEENRLLMRMLLPDGNRPAAKDIQVFTLDMVKEGRMQEGARVVNALLDIFPGDYACSDALYILCKYDPFPALPMLHRSLCGLVSNSANGSSYYRRDFTWNAKLLAAVNAVVKTLHMESAVEELNHDYDSNEPAGNYCLRKKPETTMNVVNTINRIQRDITNNLENFKTDELKRECQGILSWATGNWTEFLLEAWREKENLSDASKIQPLLQMEQDENGLDSIGFARSLLRSREKLEHGDWIPFLRWVCQALDWELEKKVEPFNLRGKLRQLYFAKDLVDKNVINSVGEMSLELPLEEYSLVSLIQEELIKPCQGVDPRLQYNRLWLLGATVDYHALIQFQYSNHAQAAFRVGDDTTAAVYYEAMLRLLSRGLYYLPTMKSSNFNTANAQFEAYARVSRLMLNDSEIRAYVGTAKFNPWSCLNMNMVLLCSARANQALQMAEKFHKNNRWMSQILIQGLNPEVPDRVKLDSIQRFPNENIQAKAYLTHLMSLGSRVDGVFRSAIFADGANSWAVKRISQDLAEKCPKVFYRKSGDGPFVPSRTLLTTLNQVHPSAYEQLKVESSAPSWEEEPAATGETLGFEPQVLQLPAFARGLKPLEGEENPEALKRDRADLPPLKRYYHDRLQLSEKIFRIRISGEAAPENTLPALVDLGLDYYDYHMDQGTPEEIAMATAAIMELVEYADDLKNSAGMNANSNIHSAIRTLGAKLDDSILYSMLDKGYLTIHSLIEHFAKDRKIFGLIQNMVQQDSYRRESVDIIYSALDQLVSCFTTNQGNSLLLREGLVKAQRRIGTISYGPWQPLKNKLQSLIQSEVNAMDRRPILTVSILNRQENPEEDNLYGEIRNEGLETAEEIIIQVTYDDSSSDRYRLASLPPREHNVFSIPYSAPPGATSLHYVFSGTYQFKGEVQELPRLEDTLPITQVDEPMFPRNLYETETITDFYLDEEGRLGNPDFFGRERETMELRNLFRSGRFPSYNNAIIYGIRRAGKTTLLNYVKAYVRLNCKDAIVVKVDCLNNASTYLIQSLFIDRVLDAILTDYPEYKKDEQWQSLREEWKLPEDSPVDRAPEKLELFYQELKRVTGKGLILMLDEVDNFFTAVERQTSLDSYLFQTLSNMLCSSSCQEAVHFLFCGSKYLLRYRTGDGGISQLFQRFGSNIIEVGLIPKAEMRKMLLKPYEEYPQVQFTEEAINWIWEYTQGLVWHVKLLANMVLKHVHDQGRSIVYPVDVKAKIWSLVQKEYCEQFFDGINDKVKDKQERMVVDAMQSMATNRSTYITRNTLITILTSEALPPEIRMTADQVDMALSNLIKLRLVTESQAEKGYRFPVDLYRLYFRTQREFPFIFRRPNTAEPSFFRM